RRLGSGEIHLTPVSGALHLGDVYLIHFQHRLGGTPRAIRVWVGEQLVKPGRYHRRRKSSQSLKSTELLIRSGSSRLYIVPPRSKTHRYIVLVWKSAPQ